MTTTRRTAWLAGAALLLLTATGAAEAAEKITIGYLRGSSGAPIEVMKAPKFAEKHGLDVDAKGFLDVAAMDRAFVLGEYDVPVRYRIRRGADTAPRSSAGRGQRRA